MKSIGKIISSLSASYKDFILIHDFNSILIHDLNMTPH